VTENLVMSQNYNKLIIQMLFTLLLTLPFDQNIAKLSVDISTAIAQSVYTVFKAQVLMAQTYRDNLGQCKLD